MRSEASTQADRASCSFHIAELDCAEEATTLRQVLAGQPGILQLHFDYLRSRMDVDYDPERTAPSQVLQRISAVGMHGQVWSAEQPVSRSASRRLGLLTASGFSIALAFVLHWILTGSLRAAIGALDRSTATPLPTIIFYGLAVIVGLVPIAPRAAASLRRTRADMHVLVCIAVIGAMVLGEWFEAAAVAFLFSLALELEQWSIGRARHAITSLMNLAPATAHCQADDGGWYECPLSAVNTGQRILIRPGERVPVDGEVVAGESLVNQAPITGESQPVAKGTGDAVFAGTINTDRALEIVATHTASDSTLARILQIVQDAQRHRAPSERWVETFARYYTPAMMGSALIVALLPPAFAWISWGHAAYSALVLLVVACPCALVISTPVTIVSALAAAARAGVLIKGGKYLELCAHLDAIALDKTGTLTYGTPIVERIVPLTSIEESELLRIAAALESQSMHPLAHAIRHAAAKQHVGSMAVSNARLLSGLGVEAMLDGDLYWLGGERLVAERAPRQVSQLRQRPEWSEEGHSLIAVGRQDQVLGAIVVADRIREDAAQTIQQLRAIGVRAVHMLTGDHQAAAERVASHAGVDHFVADALPEDKLRAVEQLRERYGRVAMIGDGVNDGPAMAAATIGIAMGAIGSDTALEVADIALISDDLSRVPWLIQHARRTARTVMQNIALALGIKVLFVLLAIANIASLWTAIAADMGASLVVIANGLRLLRGK